MLPQLFSHLPYRRYWLGQCSSFLAYNMVAVAIGWQVYDITGSALHLGLVGLVKFIPQFLLTLVVGQVADRFDRRQVVLICQRLEALVVCLLAAGSMAGIMDEHTLFTCAFFLGALRSFEAPTLQTVLPGILSAEKLPQGLALSAAGRQAGIIIGPALGGIIYALGPEVAYGVSALGFLAASLWFTTIPSPPRQTDRAPVTLDSLFGGIRYIRNNTAVLGAISLDLFSVLLGGATALLPVYARDILLTGPWGLGLLRAAPAVGALCMSLFLTRTPLRSRVGHIMFAAVAVFGLATIVFGLSQSFPLSLAALVILGAADMVSVVIRSSLIQLDTPDHMRGRVNAVNSIFIGASNNLGEFESGLTAAWFGVVPAVVIGGIGTIAVTLLWMRLFPALRQRQTLTAQH